MSEHDDLSDDELRARLIQRGIAQSEAAWLVERRESPMGDARIRQVLRGS